MGKKRQIYKLPKEVHGNLKLKYNLIYKVLVNQECLAEFLNLKFLKNLYRYLKEKKMEV